jgi:hypothetical protein
VPDAGLNVERAIVVGAPRSGTTFLMGVLDSLASVESVSGNLLPVGIAHLAAQELPDYVREGLERSLRGALTDYLESGLYRSRSAAIRKWWVASRRPSSLPSAVRGRRAEQTLVYKEPFFAFAPEFPLRAVPSAQVLLIVRDGRDVADSLVRSYDVLSDKKLATLDSNEVQFGRRTRGLYVPWLVPEADSAGFLDASPYLRAVWMWRYMATRCRELLTGSDVASGRVLTVRYENLMADPIGEGEAIARHLGRQLSPSARKRLGSAHANSIGAHHRRPAAEVRAAEELAGDELRALGYQLRSGDS